MEPVSTSACVFCSQDWRTEDGGSQHLQTQLKWESSFLCLRIIRGKSPHSNQSLSREEVQQEGEVKDEEVSSAASHSGGTCWKCSLPEHGNKACRPLFLWFSILYLLFSLLQELHNIFFISLTAVWHIATNTAHCFYLECIWNISMLNFIIIHFIGIRHNCKIL